MKREETPATAYLVNILPFIALLGLQVASLSLFSSYLPLARFCGRKGANAARFEENQRAPPSPLANFAVAGNSKFPRDGQLIVTRLRGTFQPLHFCTETTNKTKRDHDVSIYPIRRPHRDGTHFLPSTTPRDSLMGSIQIIYALRFFQKSLVRNMKLVPGFRDDGLFYI